MSVIKQDRVAEIKLSYQPAISRKPVIQTSLDAFVELIEFFPLETIALKEYFFVMYLNRANRVLGIMEAGHGGLTCTVADVRLILSAAIKAAATGIILCHNHPSGSLKPSQSDIDLTHKIKSACSYLDISVLDHLIVSPARKFLSLADEGHL